MHIAQKQLRILPAVAQSVEENPGLCIPRRSLELVIPQRSLYRIMLEDLGLTAYKVQLTQELKPAHHQQRHVFADWVLVMPENDLEFHRKIILTDETYFHLEGYVKKQNCWIWAEENSRFFVEKHLHSEGLTVMLNGLHYREMINDLLWSELDVVDLDNVYFQQYCAMCHTSNETIDLLREKFPNRVIPRRGDRNWSP